MGNGVMRRELPLPQELWDQIPAHVQAALWVVVDGYEQRIATLEAQVAGLQGEVRELKEQLNQTSQNSSRPPSSDGPRVQRQPPRKPSGRKRGAQPGHPPYSRTLIPVEQVAEVVSCQPHSCRRCGQALHGRDPQPRRHQVLEVPPATPQVTASRLHRLVCARCGRTSSVALAAGVPASSYGPRLARLIALCGGAYRMSKRMIASFCADEIGRAHV